MIDYQKIETFRALGDKKGKAELIKYAVELGVDAKKSMEFDEIVKSIESGVIVEDKPEIVEPIVQPIIEPIPVVIEEQKAPIVDVQEIDTLPAMSFGVMGEDFTWAWNMSNINNSYWFSCIDASQYAELKSEQDSEFKSYVLELIKKSGIPVVVREPRNSMFVQLTADGISESSVIYL